MKKIIIILFALELSLIATAQEERSIIRKGNKAYSEKKYQDAATQYDKALQINPSEVNVFKNSASANYRSDNFEKSVKSYNEYLRTDLSEKERAETYYNLGNTYMQANKYKESVESYRNALKLDPTHDKSRHNMAVATKILQQQQNQQQQNQQQQNQDKKDQQKNDQKNNDQQQQQNQQQQPQQQDNQMSKEEMERYLESLQQQEKETQDKVKKAQQAQKRPLEKNW